jgi:hypothetical protein
MYLLFLDESGDKLRPGTGATPQFVLGGVAIPDYGWHDVATHLRTVKDYFGISQWPEIKWRHVGAPFDPTGKPTETKPLINMPHDRRKRLALAILDVVAKRPFVIVFGAIVDKGKLLTRLGSVTDFDRQVYDSACTSVLESFQRFLHKAPALPSRLGSVIQDEQSDAKGNKFAREFFRELIAKGTYRTDFPNIVEGLSLLPSHHSVGIQIADFCVGAIGRRVRTGQREFFDAIEPNVNKARRGNRLLGLRVVW